MFRVIHPGSGSRIRTFIPSRIPDPRSRCTKTGSRIRIRNTDFKIEIVTTLNTPCLTNLALNNTSVTTLYNRQNKVFLGKLEGVHP
jgi:hypothetical protein